MKMEDDMELIELWIENIRGWHEMRASHKNLQSMSLEVEGWFALVEVQGSADFMAAASTS